MFNPKIDNIGNVGMVEQRNRHSPCLAYVALQSLMFARMLDKIMPLMSFAVTGNFAAYITDHFKRCGMHIKHVPYYTAWAHFLIAYHAAEGAMLVLMLAELISILEYGRTNVAFESVLLRHMMAADVTPQLAMQKKSL